MNKHKHVWTSVIVGLVIAGGAVAGNVTLPHTFTAGTPARASEVNANFTAVKTAVDDNNARINTILAPRTYTAPTFLTGWANVGGSYQTAGYTKDALGFVHLRGIVKRTASNAAGNIFNLPTGMRPSLLLQFPARCGNDTLCYVQINSNGNVDFGGPAGADPSGSLTLDGIVFDPS